MGSSSSFLPQGGGSTTDGTGYRIELDLDLANLIGSATQPHFCANWMRAFRQTIKRQEIDEQPGSATGVTPKPRHRASGRDSGRSALQTPVADVTWDSFRTDRRLHVYKRTVL